MKKIILINFCVIIGILILAELSARFYIKISHGSQSAGLKERNLNLNYEPFVMYGPNWKQKFKNFNKKKDLSKYTVLILGGSTAQGLESKILKKYLDKALQKKTQIFNAAYGGYISTQELIVLTRFAKNLDPDLIININGANDIVHSIRPKNEPGTFFLSDTYKNFLSKPFSSIFLYLLQNSQFYNGLLRLSARNRIFNVNDYDTHLDIYLDNVESMYLYSKAIDAKYLNILQPHIIFKNTKNEKEIEFKAFNYREEIIKKLYSKLQLSEINKKVKVLFYYDSTKIFNDNPNHIFSDDVHFINNDGYEILSKFISEKVIIE